MFSLLFAIAKVASGASDPTLADILSEADADRSWIVSCRRELHKVGLFDGLYCSGMGGSRASRVKESVSSSRCQPSPRLSWVVGRGGVWVDLLCMCMHHGRGRRVSSGACASRVNMSTHGCMGASVHHHGFACPRVYCGPSCCSSIASPFQIDTVMLSGLSSELQTLLPA